MSTKKIWFLILWVLLFAVFLGLSIWLESPVCLHIASAIPILIVLCLPNREQNQYIRARHLKKVRLLAHDSGENGRLTISFTPGFIRWKQGGKLYFHLNTLSRGEAAAESANPHQQASLSVLPYDLAPHPSKSGWVGIDLEQLAARTASLAITTDEVVRLIIPLQDLEQVAVRHMAGLLPVGNNSKRLHA
ncbi:hypothetical protein SAMN02799630_02977 [Paenibacillus sp. UNCCL117]|uniref:hypothetical protein n=1 Tax=unclassified Paenibacillus TaxID=185978 RepID=UPI000885166D|nr:MULTISPECIES: hypothetical protein [unclassified Paenibacillus]SDE23604.1 hypothetical protein SAMN04488602_12279 [Paenibacillus sp. cl123]SFW42540.1 hypothetical protein SAMN02799630_02977 [Paenibacillus sp. UNCCL117]